MTRQSLNERTARYRRAVAEEWRDLTVTVHGEERRLPLERVFFMLQARERPEPKPTEPPRPDLDPARARLQDAGAPPPPQPPPPPVPLEAALAKGEHMALLGEPGAGKSTALQFIGLCFARADENWHRERLGIQRPYIPILLNLQARAYAIAGQETLWDALRAEVRERLQCPEDEAEALLRAWRQEPGLLVLLDGLDEAPGALREAVRERIRRFAQSGAGWVILTSRPAGFQPLPGLREYLLKPFEDPEAEALPYLRGWLAALKPEWTAEEAGARARELLERMRAHPALRRLLDNPLLLRLSAQHYAQAGEIARSRADLYRLWVEEAWERARRRGAKEEEKPRFLEALQALAWHLHTGGGNEEADLLQALQRFGPAQEASRGRRLAAPPAGADRPPRPPVGGGRWKSAPSLCLQPPDPAGVFRRPAPEGSLGAGRPARVALPAAAPAPARLARAPRPAGRVAARARGPAPAGSGSYMPARRKKASCAGTCSWRPRWRRRAATRRRCGRRLRPELRRALQGEDVGGAPGGGGGAGSNRCACRPRLAGDAQG
jgi:energy-coupling factor transporter ATP-binding protein EcfA2